MIASALEERLDALFTQTLQKRASANAQGVRERDRADAFVGLFRERRESVIRPTMMAIGQLVQVRGLEFSVEASNERRPGGLKRTSTDSITMAFFLGGRHQQALRAFPFVSFTCFKAVEKIDVYMSTRSPLCDGEAGPYGSYTSDRITEAFVEDRIIELLAKVL